MPQQNKVERHQCPGNILSMESTCWAVSSGFGKPLRHQGGIPRPLGLQRHLATGPFRLGRHRPDHRPQPQGPLAVQLINIPARHRGRHQLSEGPNQGVDPVRRVSGGAAIERSKGARFVFQLWKDAEMMHPALLVKRADRLGPSDFSSARRHGHKCNVRVDRADYRFDHLAAKIGLGDDAIGLVFVIKRDRDMTRTAQI